MLAPLPACGTPRTRCPECRCSAALFQASPACGSAADVSFAWYRHLCCRRHAGRSHPRCCLNSCYSTLFLVAFAGSHHSAASLVQEAEVQWCQMSVPAGCNDRPTLWQWASSVLTPGAAAMCRPSMATVIKKIHWTICHCAGVAGSGTAAVWRQYGSGSMCPRLQLRAGAP